MKEESIIAIVCAILSSGVLATLLSGIINYLANKKQIREGRDDAVVAATMILLEDRINSHGRKYVAQGFIYQDDKDRLTRMWKSYKTFDGDGYLDGIMNLVSKLEVKIR
jgi:hypothetical protein